MTVKKILPYIISVFFFFILLAVFYPDRVFNQGFRWGDITLSEEIPQAAFFIKTIKQGSFPLWNPYKACGLPFFEYTCFAIYHPATILYFILSLERAINSIFLGHIFITALFVFFLCREFNLYSSVSFFCSVSWMLSNIFHYYSQHGYLSEAISASSLPVLVYFFMKVFNTDYPKKAIYSVCLSMLVALTITGGHPPLTAIVMYSVLVFILFSIKNRSDIGTLLGIFLWALLLSIVYWGPIFIINPPKLIFSAERGTLYSLSDLKNFFSPVSLSRGYAGIVVFILGLIGLFLRNQYAKNIRILFMFSLLLILSFGKDFSLSNFIPVANNTHQPFEWHIGLIFSLILSAGFCLNKAMSALKKINGFRIIGSFAICICILLQISDLYRFNRTFYAEGSRFKLTEYFPIQPVSTFFINDLSSFRVSNEYMKLEYLRKAQGMLYGFNILQFYSKGILLDQITGVRRLKQGMAWNLDNKEMARGLLNLCNVKYIVTLRERNTNDFIRLHTWEGRYDSLYPAPPEGDEHVYKLARRKFLAYLYENKRCFPRAFLVQEGTREKTNKAFLNTNYTIPSLIRTDIPEDAMRLLSNYKNVDIRWLPNTYEVSLESDSDSFLFLSEMYYSGWKATLDGKAVKIETPFNFFMGTFVPPGRHIVRFYFAPTYYYIFAGISLLTLVFLIGRLVLFFTNEHMNIDRATL